MSTGRDPVVYTILYPLDFKQKTVTVTGFFYVGYFTTGSNVAQIIIFIMFYCFEKV